MSLDLILLIVAAVLALPGGLFAAYLVSQPRTRMLGLACGVLGDIVVAIGLALYIVLAHVTIDAVSWFLGAFLACSMGLFSGALLVNFFAGGGRSASVNSLES